jgi:DNA repair protein RadC
MSDPDDPPQLPLSPPATPDGVAEAAVVDLAAIRRIRAPKRAERAPKPVVDPSLDQAGHRSRLRLRFLTGGPDYLPDYELIEMILFAGNPRGDTKPLAKELLRRFSSFADVVAAPVETLRKVPGLGDAGIAALKAVHDGASRLARSRASEQPVLASWDKVIDYVRVHLAHNTIEAFHVLFLDGRNRLIRAETQQRGTVDHTPVYPREVMKRALELGATAFIMVHNHPTPPVSITLDHA